MFLELENRSNLKGFLSFSIQSCTSVVKSRTRTSERSFLCCYWTCSIGFRFPDPRQIFLLGNIATAGGHHWLEGQLRTVVDLDGNMGEGRLGGRGPESERGQRVGLSGVIETRSGAQDLDATLFALLHHPRLQLLRHLVKRADRKDKRVL